MAHTSGYTRFAKAASSFCGNPRTFIVAILMIVIWVISGPFFHYSDTWQLVINTSTTIITFLMVFVIQNSQNRDTEAMELKLDELLRATEGAHNSLINLENSEEEFLRQCQAQYRDLALKAGQNLAANALDTDCPPIVHSKDGN